MRRKIMSLGLSAMLIGSMLVGCGTEPEFKHIADVTPTESVTTETSTTGEASTEESTEVSDEFANIDENGIVREGVVYTVDDLKTALLTDNFQLTTSTNGLDMVIALAGGNSRVSMACEYEGVDIKFDMYTMGSDLYSSMTNEQGVLSYYHAVADESTASSMVTDDSFSIDLDSVKTVEYVITKKYEGVVYDVVKVGTSTFEAGEGVTIEFDSEDVDLATMSYTEYYINPSTKMVEYAMMDDVTTGEKVIGKYDVISEITLPAEFTSDSVIESTAEDIASQLLGMMFLQFSDISEEMHNN